MNIVENPSQTIGRIRSQMGGRLSILGHHYQSDDVIRFTDIQGDSLELARKINDLDAEHIVFCGVYFMAESAAILCRDDPENPHSGRIRLLPNGRHGRSGTGENNA